MDNKSANEMIDRTSENGIGEIPKRPSVMSSPPNTGASCVVESASVLRLKSTTIENEVDENNKRDSTSSASDNSTNSKALKALKDPGVSNTMIDPCTAGSSKNALSSAVSIILNNKRVLALGLTIGFFESAMFIFVFLWTPAITQNPEIKNAQYGLIFALFMMGCMLGSSVFAALTRRNYSAQEIAVGLFAVAAASHAVPVISGSEAAMLVSFIVFECCVGVYFPTIGMLKSKIVPEANRSMLYNLFRVPLNLIVVLVLLVDLPVQVGFGFTTLCLLACLVLIKKVCAAPDEQDDQNSSLSPTSYGRQFRDGEGERLVGSASTETPNIIPGDILNKSNAATSVTKDSQSSREVFRDEGFDDEEIDTVSMFLKKVSNDNIVGQGVSGNESPASAI